jgi:hypothetical protein
VVGRDDRLWLILLLAWIAGGTGRRADVEAARAAVRVQLPQFQARLDVERDPSLQVALAQLAAQFPEDAEESRPRLQRLVAAETEDPRRLVLEIALAAVGGEVDEDNLLRRLPDDYYDREEVAELRKRLERDEHAEVYRDILDSISGSAMKLKK